jgi:hypothetical protein
MIAKQQNKQKHFCNLLENFQQTSELCIINEQLTRIPYGLILVTDTKISNSINKIT